jgi:hypothetical protein
MCSLPAICTNTAAQNAFETEAVVASMGTASKVLAATPMDSSCAKTLTLAYALSVWAKQAAEQLCLMLASQAS